MTTPPPPPPQPELTGGGAGRGAGRDGVLTEPPPQPLEALVRLLVDAFRARFNSSAEVDFGFPFPLGFGLQPEAEAPQPVATGWRFGVVFGFVEPTPQPEAALGRLFPPRLTVVMSGSPSARGAACAPGVSRLPSARSGTSCRAR